VTGGDRGGGCSIPLPVSPSPTGAIVRRYSATGEISFSWFQARTPRRILSLSRTRPPSQAVGVVYEHRSTAETGDRGGGSSIPLPVSPSPTGAIPHGYSVPGFGSLVAVSPDTPERSSLRPWHGYPVLSPFAARPLEGAGGGRGAAGRWGLIDCSHGKTSSVARRDRAILPRYSPPDLRLTRATSQPPGPRRPPLRSAAYARRYRARGLL